MSSKSLRAMVEVSLAVGLSLALSLITLYRMPQGGSVSLEMLPLFVVAFRRGGKWGIIAGGVLGLMKLLIDPFIQHPIQVLLDYPVPFALLGIAGFFPKQMALGMVTGAVGRFLSHVLSGVVFWGAYTPEGVNPWIYSISYNATYLVVETVMVIALVMILRKRRELIDPQL